MEELTPTLLQDKVTVFMGAGVGKSTLNRIAPELALETGAISDGLGAWSPYHLVRSVSTMLGKIADTLGFHL